MRVISGIYKGKKISGFDIEGTRPTKDRVKESIFATLQNNLKDSVVLDLFAGSGSLGLEALSNGCKICYFVDNNKVAINTINKNMMEIKNKVVLEKNYKEALKYFCDNKIKFDIILLDPPYKDNLLNNSINFIEKHDLLNDGGILVCEYENDEIITNLELVKNKKYGKTNVKFYRKTS